MKLRTTFATLLAAALIASLGGTRAAADLFVNAPAITVEGDGVNPSQGVLEFRLGVTGVAPEIAAYTIRFESPNAAVTFGTPTPVITAPLFDPGLGSFMNNSDASNIWIIRDLASPTPPYSVQAFDGAGLLRVPFTVAPGYGTFAIQVDLASEFADALGQPLGFSPGPGSITVIAAVPEASAAALLATVVTVTAATGLLVQHRRRRRALPLALPC